MNSIARKINAYEAEIRRSGSCSVSHGTLRTFDLVHAFLNVLNEMDPPAYREMMGNDGLKTIPFSAIDDADADWWNTDVASDVLTDLEDKLSELAPEGFQFGSHEGDGSDFGFWPVDED